MAHAWVENGVVREVARVGAVIAECYTPEIAARFSTVVPDTTRPGATLVGGVWTNPAPPPAPARTWGLAEVRAGLSLAERVRWDNNQSAAIVTVKIEFAAPRVRADASAVLALVVSSGDVSQASVNAILA